MGLVVLLVLALPIFAIRLGFSDNGNRPANDSLRQAYDLLAEGFGPGFNGSLLLAAELPRRARRPARAGRPGRPPRDD